MRHGAVGDTAKTTPERRCRRSARRPAALHQPPGVASRVGEAAPRLPEPLGYEDGIYRFYHHSFKIYSLQETTSAIVAALWLEVTRPMVEAFFHAHYFLEMAVRYGKQLKHPPRQLPSGWAAFLYLYNLR